MNGQFAEDDRMKRHPTSLAIREIKIQTMR